MKIWVDADACPGVIKDILFRAAQRTSLPLSLVANHAMNIPKAANINLLQVATGFDEADKLICARVNPGDLVITGDIPLAADVLQRGAMALNPRGEQYDSGTIQAKLTMRDFMESMRASGVRTGGPPSLNAADRKRFADQLDRILAQRSNAPD